MRQILKKILSRKIINLLKIILIYVDNKVISIARRSQWLAGLYYFLVSSQFRREMHAVLNGRFHFDNVKDRNKSHTFMLRRNIHRIEKGLCMVPRKPIFAAAYIEATVRKFEICMSFQCIEDTECEWVHDVLEHYFSVVEQTSEIKTAKKIFDRARKDINRALKTKKIPFTYKRIDAAGIKFDDFKTLCENRHSVRWFRSKRVPIHIIEQSIEVAVTAPSACNRQPFKFHIFDDPEQAKIIGSIPMGTAGFAENFQCVIVVVADLSAYPFEKDRHIIYIDSSLATMQLLLALELHGLSSCVINWPDIERHERQMAEKLELEAYQRPIMLISVGYAEAEGMIPFSDKKPLKDVVWRAK
jgi:nitroreductase